MIRDIPRETALKALFSWDREGAYGDAAIKQALDESGLAPRDAAFATRLFYLCIEQKLLIDYTITHYSEIRIKKLHPAVRQIMRLGACQLLFMDNVPDSAAVNTSVELARLRGLGSAAGYINATLRKIAVEGLPEITGEKRDVLSVKYSHPRWLTDLFCDRFGEKTGEQLLQADNSAPPMTVRVNTLKIQPEALAERLAEKEILFTPDPEIPICGTLSGTGRVDALPEFEEGLFTVQDKASVCAVLAAGLRPGDRVLDLCAAPGGKSLCAAACMENRGEILAGDLHPHKAALIGANALRLGADIITPCTRDASVFDPALEECADVVIADVPCTGLGVIRKKPDLRYKDPETFRQIEAVAKEIARCAARYVRPGGILLYSTCTLRREENEEVRDLLLSEFPGLFPKPFCVSPSVSSDDGQITLLPPVHGTDGFYFATFKKRG